MEKLSAEAFKKLREQGAGVADLRAGESVIQGFIKESLAFGSSDNFLAHAHAFMGAAQPGKKQLPLLLIGDPEADLTAQLNLANIPIKGFLDGGWEAWVAMGGEVDMLIDIEPDELMMDIPFDDNLVILDIRPEIAFAEGHLKDAVNIPLSQFSDPLRLAAIEDKDNLYLLGENSTETILAATYLKKHEIHNLRIVTGGWEAVQKEEKAEIVKDPRILN